MCFFPPSVVAVTPPTLAAVALPRFETTLSTNSALLEQHTAGLLHDPRARDALPRRPRTHHAPHVSAHIAPVRLKRGTKRAVRKQAPIGLDWKGSSATVVDLGSSCRLSRGRTRARALDQVTEVRMVDLKRLASILEDEDMRPTRVVLP